VNGLSVHNNLNVTYKTNLVTKFYNKNYFSKVAESTTTYMIPNYNLYEEAMTFLNCLARA